MGGSGRIWVQPGSGARLEVQGNGSDFVVVGGKGGIWTYSSATGTATQYARPAGAATPSQAPSASASAVDPLAAITKGLQRFASTGTVAVAGQQTVAGRQSYVLSVTPAPGTVTTFGSVRVAVDGTTYVPLQVQVFAKGDTTPALSAGFTSVSYSRNDRSLFSFTPPAGAAVQHRTLPAMPGATSGMTAPASVKHAPLTLAQAQAKAKSYGLTLAVPAKTAALPFEGATVTAARGGHGASAILHYGRGFGSVVLVESSGTTGRSGGLTQQLAKLPQGLLTTTTIGGAQAHELSTSLVGVIAWQRGPVTLLAGGMVPSSTLQEFAAGVR
jgi:outer membrane lipoprotein-sorting protein